MKYTYECPKCRGVLNPTWEIVLNGRMGAVRALFLFNPEPGNYEYRTDPAVHVHPGQCWEFQCPLCRFDLTTPYSSALAHLKMVDQDANQHAVVFSKIAGEHATFDVTEEGVFKFGEHSANYIEFSIDHHYW